MLTLLRLSLLVLLGFCGAFAGAAIGALFVPRDSGMAGPAMVFWSAVAGFVGSIVAGAILAWRLRKVALRMALLVAVILAALAIAWIGSRLDVQAAAIQSPANMQPTGTNFAAPSAANALKEADSKGQRPASARPEPANPQPERTDYLTFAQGAVPVSIGGAGAKLGAGYQQAIRATDGNPAGFSLTNKPTTADGDVEFIYQLPAATTFDRFAVPSIPETPSPSQTFTKQVEVHGSTTGPNAGFVLLGSGTLATSKKPGDVTELTVHTKTPARWIKLRLVGGVQVTQPAMFFEFSEIIGNGTQEAPAMADRFRGIWKGRGVHIQLRQEGPLVSGCYDRGGELTGTVTGNLLRATGVTRSDGVPSAFILTVNDDGSLRGVRSTNRGPFALYTGEAAPTATPPSCPSPAPLALGCGAVIHGIAFDFDSATIRSESDPVLARLFDGLRQDRSATVTIEGHTSSEGTDEYNQRLSERRAQAVVADLVKRGIAASQLKAVGFGEKQPIASNDDESGRSINRRVEVECAQSRL